MGDELGPAERPNSVLSSAGLTKSTADGVVVLPFNDAETCEQIINENADQLAAIIIDPLSTGAGFTLPEDGFLSKLREITKRADVLLIFDEIISFRSAHGGAQETYNIRPDLTCLAKVIAGGVPGAAFGGRADILALYDPTTTGTKDSSRRNFQCQSTSHGGRIDYAANHDTGRVCQDCRINPTVGKRN